MEFTNFTIEILVFLFLVATIAGFLDTLAGGGGLISIPALIMSGIPPLLALGTNKLQGSMGTATATYLMLKNKKVVWNNIKHPMLAAFIGAALGTIAIQFINTEVLAFVIPTVLLVIAIYFLISPKPREGLGNPRLSKDKYQKIVMPSIGCYDGAFGPGTGSFFALAGVSLRGYGLIDSTATAKTLNFSTNIASLIVFLIAGKIVWGVGFIMMLGQAIGAWAGSHCLYKINPNYLRLIVVVMCLGMLGKYVFTKGWL